MIRCIAAIDEERGFANDHGIPWQGKIPGDSHYYLEQIAHKDVLMGYGTYQALKGKPANDGVNFVVTSHPTEISSQFKPLEGGNLDVSLAIHPDLWIIGGQEIYRAALPFTNELYITQLQGRYGCNRFFPPYQHNFELRSESAVHTENGISYTFQIWERRR